MIKNTIFHYVLLLFFPLLVSLNSYALDCNTVEFKITNPSLTYCVGQDVTLTTDIKNTDGGTIAYKWYAPGSSTAITNETSSSLKITNIDDSKKGKYKCRNFMN